VLNTLYIGSNKIGDEGAKAIGKALEVNEVLTSLDVGFNGLTEKAALSIVRVERQRNKLTSLGLARCNIGPTVAVEIAQYVSDSEVLEKIDLRVNREPFGRRGGGSDSRCGERAGRVRARDVSG